MTIKNEPQACRRCEEIETQLGETGEDAEIVYALREWFNKRGVPYERMDPDTAYLWKVLTGK